MDFTLSERQHALQEQVRDIVSRVVEPIASSIPPNARVSADQLRGIYRALQPTGYLGSTIPEDLGGAGLSYVDYGLLLEALAEGPLFLGEVVPPRTIHYLGSVEQKARWIPRLCSGEWISTAAITEPQAGSDLRGLETTAVSSGGSFRVNGVKKWIKLGGVADFLTLLVVSGREPDGGAKTSRLLLERARSPWRSVELAAVGLEKVSLAELHFEDCDVPGENLLGSPGLGAEQFNRGIESSRAFVGIQAASIARKALDAAVAYAGERHAFGRPISRFQSIQDTLADAATRLDAARLLCLRALALLDSGQRCPREISMAKLYATETAVAVCHAAMDCMGAHGLSREAGVERAWRDCRMLTVIDGTSGIQRLVIGRELLGVPAFV